MIQDGVPLEVVKDVLGHEDIETKMKYAHHKDDAKRTAMMTLAAQYCRNEKKESIA